MKAEKLLAEWFWLDRWDGSSAALLPMEAQGIYRAMLSQAWRRGARLPKDLEAIQRAVRCTTAEWERCWPLVAPYWREDGNSLVNDTQLEIYDEAVKRRDRAHAKAMKAAAAAPQVRAKAEAQAIPQAQACAGSEVEPEVTPPSPSPSPLVNTLVVGREVVAPPRNGPTRLPASPFPEQRASDNLDAEIRRLQSELGRLLDELTTHRNSRDMLSTWSRKVTAYTNNKGQKVSGAPDYRLVHSIDRLERSIEDAKWWLSELDKRKGPENEIGAR